MPIDITMPRLSDTMEIGTIIKWNVKEGDKVSAGDVIADVETDKATMEMTAYDDGTVAKITVPEGQKATVGTVIAVLDTGSGSASPASAGAGKSVSIGETKGEHREAASGGGVANTAATKMIDSRVAPEPREDASEERRAIGDRDDSSANGRIKVSPVARHLADDHGIDIRSIEGTGPGGRVIKRDILAAMEAAKETSAAVAPSARGHAKPQAAESTPLATRVPMTMQTGLGGVGSLEAQIVPLTNMRQIIARRLVESKTTIPHYQVTVTFNMDPLLDLRSTLNQQLESQGVKLSVNDFIVRACALAMHQHPYFNSSWPPGGDHIEINGEVNIGIAISLPPERGGGLVVATIRNADQKGLRQISFESKNLAEKARTRGLTIQEMSDSTFTISNLGMFGVDHFTAIINPPNSAIIAVGAAIEKPVVRDHQLTIGHEMNATLSCDHRVIDGAMAAQYLKTLKELIENPGTLLV